MSSCLIDMNTKKKEKRGMRTLGKDGLELLDKDSRSRHLILLYLLFKKQVNNVYIVLSIFHCCLFNTADVTFATEADFRYFFYVKFEFR